jgi:hypothetical protein
LAVWAGCQDATAPIVQEETVTQFAKQPQKGVWTVTTLDDVPPDDPNCTPSYCALRQAVTAATDGDRIVFKNGLSGTIELVHGTIALFDELTIDAGGRIEIDAVGTGQALVVHWDATIELRELVITGGTEPGSTGGAMRNEGMLTLIGCTLTGNSAHLGGAIFNGESATLTLIDSDVSNNSATHLGGGLYNSAGAGTAGTMTIVRSTISGNGAQHGAGIYNAADPDLVAAGGILTVMGTTITGNGNGVNGGAIYNGGALELRNSTVTLNGGVVGGVFSELAGASALVMNSIIAGNIGDECTPSSLTSLGYNLTTADAEGCGFTDATDVVVPPFVVFSAVLEADLNDNGGPTRTHALIERGRAVDSGYCPGENSDQRGFSRPVDDPLMPNALDSCDVGAFEWAPAPESKGKKKS